MGQTQIANREAPLKNNRKRGFTEAEIEELETGTKKTLRKKILQLAGPSLVEMVLINLVQMLNMIMVGRVGAAAVTAVGLTNQPVFFGLAAFTALDAGTTAIVARSFGSGDTDQANRAAQQTFLLNLALSVVVVLLTYPFTKQLLVFMGAAPDVLAEGVSYAQITFLSMGFMTVSMSLSAVLRGAGDTRTPMVINVLSNILVVVLGFPMIYGFLGIPAMGVKGAAISTMIARFVSTVWVVYVLFSGKFAVRLTLKNFFMIDLQLIRRIIKIGLPAAGEQFVMRGGQVIFAKVVAGLGTIAFAANQIGFSILGLTFMPGMAFAIVATTLVGQALGAAKPELAEKFGWETRKIGSIVAGSIGLLFVLFAPYIMMPYTNEQAVIDQGSVALRVVGLVQIAQSTAFILAGALRGAGDTKFPLYSTLIGVWGFRVVLSLLFVLVFHWGILGAWLSIAVDQLARSFVIYIRFKSGKWKVIRV